MKPCKQGHQKVMIRIGREPAIPFEREEELYVRVCRQMRRNPWCGRPLDKCPEGNP